ncbi:MAG: PIN domain-containing protein [Coriobacteriales bacterium]|jgi:predicted nucleic acid-binding protein|nr:PIN domain-containing protein [Coriobacteriales bacterium]
MRLFLDTNIIIDFIAGHNEDGDQARLLLVPQTFGEVELTVSAKSFTDVFYVLNRHIDSGILQKRMLECQMVFKLCPIEGDDIKIACQRGWDDFEDALITVAAEKAGADYLITRDQNMPHSSIPKLDPKGFFDLLREQSVTYAIVDQ